jgi:hypothetical protein
VDTAETVFESPTRREDRPHYDDDDPEFWDESEEEEYRMQRDLEMQESEEEEGGPTCPSSPKVMISKGPSRVPTNGRIVSTRRLTHSHSGTWRSEETRNNNLFHL